MRKWLATLLAAATLLVAGCSSATNADAELATKEREIAELKAQTKQRDEELTSAKKLLAIAPAPPNQDSVAVGQGDGRFVVIPSKVRRGFPIGIFTDEGDGQIRITRSATAMRSSRMARPKASQILVYIIPKDLDPGSYRIMFFGHGGTSGEAVIQVDAN